MHFFVSENHPKKKLLPYKGSLNVRQNAKRNLMKCAIVEYWVNNVVGPEKHKIKL